MAITGRSEFSAALNQVAHERGLDPFEVLDTIKAAILAAYRRDYGVEETEEVDVTLDQETGEVSLTKDGKDATPPGFGRIAAQTAKQVLLQRIREAEKTAILVDYSKRIGTIVSGMIQRAQGPAWIVDIGRAEAVMPPREQVRNETYYLNQRLKFYISEIRDRDKRSEIIVSRTNPELVVGLFKQEVPEIAAGSVEIKAIAREPGFRTKIAVTSHQLGVDPVGSCVGQRGNRIQTVINELLGEKIDVIPHSDDILKFITASLQPAKNVRIEITNNTEGEKAAVAIVDEKELSLAIGTKGQNVRLAAKLSGYHIDVTSPQQQMAQAAGEGAATTDEAGTAEAKEDDQVAPTQTTDDTTTAGEEETTSLEEATSTSEDQVNTLGEITEERQAEPNQSEANNSVLSQDDIDTKEELAEVEPKKPAKKATKAKAKTEAADKGQGESLTEAAHNTEDNVDALGENVDKEESESVDEATVAAGATDEEEAKA